MAGIKVTEMTEATSTSPDDLLMIVNGNVNKKITYTNLLSGLSNRILAINSTLATLNTNIDTIRTDIGQTTAGEAGTGDMYIKDGMVYVKNSNGTYVPLVN